MIRIGVVALAVLLLFPLSAYPGPPIIDEEAIEELAVTPLMQAALHGRTETIKTLLKKGAEINEKTENHETSLMFAARHDRLGAVKVLLKAGADTNIRTKDGGNTALVFASYFSSPAVVRALLEAGADPNIIPTEMYGGLGSSPALEMAIQAGKIENVKILLKKGAHLRDSLGGAIYANNIEIVKLLIKHGATVQRNVSNVKHVRKEASKEMIQLLRLDEYNGPQETDTEYPVILDELASEGGIARRLYDDPNLSLRHLPAEERAILETNRMALELKVIRNTVFARKNYAFKSRWLKRYYQKHFKKYRPLTKTVELTAVDKANIAYLKGIEKMTK